MSKPGGAIGAIVLAIASLAPILRMCSKADDVARLGKFGKSINYADDVARSGKYARGLDNMSSYSKAYPDYAKKTRQFTEYIQDAKARKIADVHEAEYLKQTSPKFKEQLTELNKNVDLVNDRIAYQEAYRALKEEFITPSLAQRFAKVLKMTHKVIKLGDMYYPHDKTDQTDVELLNEKIYTIDGLKLTIPNGFFEIKSIAYGKEVVHIWLDTMYTITLYDFTTKNDKPIASWQTNRAIRGTYFNRSRVSTQMDFTDDTHYSLEALDEMTYGIIREIHQNGHRFILEIESSDVFYLLDNGDQLIDQILQ